MTEQRRLSIIVVRRGRTGQRMAAARKARSQDKPAGNYLPIVKTWPGPPIRASLLVRQLCSFWRRVMLCPCEDGVFFGRGRCAFLNWVLTFLAA